MLLRELITPEQLEELLPSPPATAARTTAHDHSDSEPVETAEPDPAGKHSERQWTSEQIARRNAILGREVT